MSMFENDQFRWRETYFVLFDSSKRPGLEQVHQSLSGLDDRFTLTNLASDDDGSFESITVLAPDNFAALDICYIEGEEVEEQREGLIREMQTGGCQAGDPRRLEVLRRCDARFDVLHFEQVAEADGAEPDEMLDPSALLVVLEGLARLTDGVAIDPQAGTAV